MHSLHSSPARTEESQAAAFCDPEPRMRGFWWIAFIQGLGLAGWGFRGLNFMWFKGEGFRAQGLRFCDEEG